MKLYHQVKQLSKKILLVVMINCRRRRHPHTTNQSIINQVKVLLVVIINRHRRHPHTTNQGIINQVIVAIIIRHLKITISLVVVVPQVIVIDIAITIIITTVAILITKKKIQLIEIR